jgi:hypothetical protein
VYVTSTHILYIDVDESGHIDASDMAINLSGISSPATLQDSDIIF